jgi:hypothetical protein
MQILRHQVVLGYPYFPPIVPRIPDIDFIKVILLILNFEYFLLNFTQI